MVHESYVGTRRSFHTAIFVGFDEVRVVFRHDLLHYIQKIRSQVLHRMFSNSHKKSQMLFKVLIHLWLVTSQASYYASASTEEEECDGNMSAILVVGATGATGKHVVHQLLNQGRQVKVVVRSKERMLQALNNIDETAKPLTQVPPGLTITEASLLDLTDDELMEQVKGTDAVVSCLGHNVSIKGLWGHPRRLVTDASRRLTNAMMKTNAKRSSSSNPPKFILMNSEGVAREGDTIRPFSERMIIFLLRHLIPPHADNEQAAAYVESMGKDSGVEWTVIRPTDLIDGPVSDYVLYDKPTGSLFGSGVAKRSNVAKSMVDMILDEKLWNQYRFEMPVVHDAKEEESQ